MAEVTPEIRALHKSWADSVPGDVLAAIDETELRDRLDEAAALRAKAGATGSPALRDGFLQQARNILKAAPREQTEAQVNALLTKAEGAATDAYRENCLAEAARLRLANHPAPRRHRPAAPAPAARRPLMYKAEAPPADPDAPVTAAQLTEMVKAEVARTRTARARGVQLDAQALTEASLAISDLTKQATSAASKVLYK
jgi:hypothetical protein